MLQSGDAACGSGRHGETPHPRRDQYPYSFQYTSISTSYHPSLSSPSDSDRMHIHTPAVFLRRASPSLLIRRSGSIRPAAAFTERSGAERHSFPSHPPSHVTSRGPYFVGPAGAPLQPLRLQHAPPSSLFWLYPYLSNRIMLSLASSLNLSFISITFLSYLTTS